MNLLNFSHPLTPEQIEQIEALSGQKIAALHEIPVQFNHEESFLAQLVALVDQVPLSATEFQTEPLLVNPPALNTIAVMLLAELHGRMGYFPPILRIRPIPGSLPPRYEVAEILNLQAVREQARQRRHD